LAEVAKSSIGEETVEFMGNTKLIVGAIHRRSDLFGGIAMEILSVSSEYSSFFQRPFKSCSVVPLRIARVIAFPVIPKGRLIFRISSIYVAR
jgi:hypothetical protein